jgi:hypothetical protein
MYYQKFIKMELAKNGFIGKYDARHIEGYMRLQNGCLDGLGKARFNHEVKISMECIDADGIENAESLAKSYGL